MTKPIKNISIKEIEPLNVEDEQRSADGMINPYMIDPYNMGESFSRTVEMMYDKHASEDRCNALFVCKLTGKRWKLTIEMSNK